MSDTTTNVKVTLEIADKAAQKAIGDYIASAEKADKAVQAFGASGSGTFHEIGLHIGKATGLYDIFAGNLAANVATKALELAGEAAKELVNTLLEAEHVKTINAQFEALAKNAGQSADVLKELFVRAGDGLVDETSIIKSANDAMIALGNFSSELPQVFELARKASAQFGGEVTDNFDAMVRAIGSGSTKGLKQFHLFISADEAVKNYAHSLGVTTDQLSETGKQHALLNAILEKGGEQFKTVDTSNLQATNSLKRLKVALYEATETAGGFFERIFGSAVSKATDGFSGLILDVSHILKANFGTANEQAAAKVQLLKDNIASLSKTFNAGAKEIEDNKAWLTQSGQLEKVLYLHNATGKKLEEYKAKLAALGVQEEDTSNKVVGAVGKTKASKEDLIATDSKATERRKAFAEQTIKDANSAKDAAAIELEAVKAKSESEIATLDASYAGKLVLDADYLAQRKAIQDEQYASEQQLATDRFVQENALLEESLANKEITEKNYFAARDFLATKFAADQSKRDAENVKAEKDLTKIKEQENKKRTENLNSTLSYISTLQQSSVKELFFIGKAAALANAYIDAQAAVMKALSAAPPPFNFVLAALVGVAAAANIAKIASSKPPQFEDGGIVGGTSFSGDKVAAQVNSGEMILNRSQQKNLFEMANGAGGSGIRDDIRALASAVAQLANRPMLVEINGKPIIDVIRGEINSGRRFT